MRAVVQRVDRASVRVEGEVVGAMGPGLLALVGVAHDDVAAGGVEGRGLLHLRRRGLRVGQEVELVRMAALATGWE